MTRPAHVVLLACVALLCFSTGCRPSSANTKLRKENQQLQARLQQLETQRSGDQSRIKALESQQAVPPLVPQDKLNLMFTAHGLSFTRLTGGYREQDDAPRDIGVVVHVAPTDEEGQTLKATGRMTITVFDLDVPEQPLVAKREFSVEEVKKSWNGRAMLSEYVLKVPFQTQPQHPNLLVRVEFSDELTGRTLTADKKVTVKI